MFSFKILSKNLLGLDFNLTIYNKALTPIYMFEIAGKTKFLFLLVIRNFLKCFFYSTVTSHSMHISRKNKIL